MLRLPLAPAVAPVMVAPGIVVPIVAPIVPVALALVSAPAVVAAAPLVGPTLALLIAPSRLITLSRLIAPSRLVPPSLLVASAVALTRLAAPATVLAEQGRLHVRSERCQIGVSTPISFKENADSKSAVHINAQLRTQDAVHS